MEDGSSETLRVKMKGANSSLNGENEAATRRRHNGIPSKLVKPTRLISLCHVAARTKFVQVGRCHFPLVLAHA